MINNSPIGIERFLLTTMTEFHSFVPSFLSPFSDHLLFLFSFSPFFFNFSTSFHPYPLPLLVYFHSPAFLCPPLPFLPLWASSSSDCYHLSCINQAGYWAKAFQSYLKKKKKVTSISHGAYIWEHTFVNMKVHRTNLGVLGQIYGLLLKLLFLNEPVGINHGVVTTKQWPPLGPPTHFSEGTESLQPPQLCATFNLTQIWTDDLRVRGCV